MCRASNSTRSGSFSAGIKGGSGGEMKVDISAHFPPTLCLRVSFIPENLFMSLPQRRTSFSPPPCQLHFLKETSFVYIYNTLHSNICISSFHIVTALRRLIMWFIFCSHWISHILIVAVVEFPATDVEGNSGCQFFSICWPGNESDSHLTELSSSQPVSRVLSGHLWRLNPPWRRMSFNSAGWHSKPSPR